VFEPLEPGTMLRIVPLAGERPDCYAVFVEPLSSRNYLDAAVKRYDITKREAEVLELLIGGFSTLEVAGRLYITEGTVGDHVKSLFRKTRANKRSELVARVFQPDWPEAPRHRDRTKSEARVPGLMIVANADGPETSRP
jgi:DNA-binding CsgD family transcriptional regulator